MENVVENVAEAESDTKMGIRFIACPSYAYENAESFTLILKGWVYGSEHTKRSYLASKMSSLVLSSNERTKLFTMHSRSNLKIQASISSFISVMGETRQIIPTSLTFFTNSTGYFHSTATIPKRDYLIEPRSWFIVDFFIENNRFSHQVQYLQSNGTAIITDVDDTIRLSNVFKGTYALLENFLFEPSSFIPDMKDSYASWHDRGVDIHYVSAAPYQTAEALLEFLRSFPTGPVSLRKTSKSTLDYKIGEIKKILTHFPLKKFILIGDDGELDAKIYSEIAQEFPDSIEKVYIRRVREEKVVVDRKADSSGISYFTLSNELSF